MFNYVIPSDAFKGNIISVHHWMLMLHKMYLWECSLSK
jgi:hypothetical protein